MLWKLHVAIFESAPYPVVEHVFYGRTKREARGYYLSHLKTDDFLRDCVRRGRWENVKCRAVMFWRQ